MSGIFLTKGSSLTIENLRIDLENPDNSSMTVKVGYDVYPLWLTTAVNQALESISYAKSLDELWDGNGSDTVTELLEKETATSMSAIVSAAAAIDAFYGSTIARAKDKKALASGSKTKSRRTRGRHKIIASVLQQRYKIRAEHMPKLIETLGQLLRIRDAALHAHGSPEEAALHPRFGLALSRKHVMFRSENAVNAAAFALSSIAWLVGAPKNAYPALVEHCGHARQWIYPIVDEWEKTQASLGIKRLEKDANAPN